MKASIIQTLIDDHYCQDYKTCAVRTDSGREYTFSIEGNNGLVVVKEDNTLLGEPIGFGGCNIFIDCAKIECILFYK